MVRQRCGSCRFFQEAGLAGSGWCHHPLRKTTNDLLIMVRKNELACRDAWSHSLWEPGKYVEEDDAAASGADAGASFAARPMAPASDSDIAAILQTSQTPGDAPREDVVLSEVRVLPSGTSAKPEPAADLDRAAQYRDLDARSAILKAREAFRERVRLDPRRSGEPEAPAAAVAEGPVVDERAAEVGSEAADQLWENEAAETWAGDDLAAEADSFGRSLVEVEPTLSDEDADERLAAEDDRFEADDWNDEADFDAEPSSADSWVTRGLFGGFGRFIHLRTGGDSRARQAPTPPVAAASEPEPDEGAVAAASERSWDHDPEAIFDAIVDRLPVEGAPMSAAEPVAAAMPIENAPRFGYRPEPPPPAAIDRAPEPETETADEWDFPVETAADVLNLVADFEDVAVGPELAPGLPRVCRTCRDFRPSEAGGRGWCANRWAFTHRRMVDAQDAAPCATSFGTWWLPVDEVWSTAYDISGHGQSTPLLDAWLPEHRVEEPQRRRS